MLKNPDLYSFPINRDQYRSERIINMKKSTITISKRCFVRIISFSAALILTLGALAAQNGAKAGNNQLIMKNSYMRAVEDLSLSLDNIKTTLNKGM